MQKKIPFSPPDITQAEIDAVTEVLRSGWITTGPRTKELEKRIGEYCQCTGAVCLSSATAAMFLALKLLGIGPGDEVVVPAYTYTATASVVCHAGARPVMVDCAPGSYALDTDQLRRAITARTKAVIPVDIGGVVCDYDAILATAEDARGIFEPSGDMQEALGRVAVIADAAHSFGSRRQGRTSGSLADFSAFSFHAVKSFTTGEGGALVWRDIPGVDSADIYRQTMLLALHGQNKDALAKTLAGAWEYDIVMPGYKYNMGDIAAAIGLAQLERYPQMIARRQELMRGYIECLAGRELGYLDHLNPQSPTNVHLMMVQLPGADEARRNAAIGSLAKRGVAANVHFKPLPMMSAYRAMGFDIDDYPQAYGMYSREITLPLYSTLCPEDCQYAARQFVQALSEL